MATKKSGTRSPAKKAKAPSDAAAHQAMLADHEKRITALEGNQPALGALIEQVRSHTSFLAEKIIATQERCDLQFLQLEQRIHADLAAFSLIVRDVADGQATLAEGQAALEKGQAALASRMDGLEATMVRLEQRTTKVEDRLTGLEGRTSGVETAIREFARSQEDHARRLEKLERAEG